MPLPEPSPGDAALAWPPPQLDKITPKLDEWSAWYAGDAWGLSEQYGGFTGTLARTRPSQLAGGLVGTIARMFWGAPTAAGQQRTKLHVPVAADIATASSDLLFAETLKIGVPEDIAKQYPGAEDRLQQLLDGNQWDSLLLEQGEVCAALGGVYLRAVWDLEVEPTHPLVSVVHADAAIPEFGYGRLRAVTFWRVVGRGGQRVQRLLERHDPGRIEWGLYEGTEDKLGRRVDFGGHPATEALIPVVDAGSGVSTGWPGLTAVYVPNMKPNRLWRKDPLGVDLGRSDFDSVEPLMDAVDETMTSWMRDIRLGKGRVIVPNYMLTPSGVGKSSTFNIDQEVFVGLALPPTDDPGGAARDMSIQQFAIRTKEHADTIRGLLSSIFRTAGYSAQTFGLADESARSGVATATEVHSRDRRSDVTREKKSRYYQDGLAKFLRALISIDTTIFNGGAGRDWLPSVEFPPSSQPSQEEEARSVQTLRAAELLSIHTGVARVNPDWTEDEVAEEVARIMEERPTVPNLGVMPGLEGGGLFDREEVPPGVDTT